jgi:transglutaminase-like putative cysteine protease
VRHTTRYRYSDAVTQCHSLTHLLPRHTRNQRCLESELRVSPRPALITSRTDYFGNHTHQFTLQQPHRVLEVTALSTLDIEDPGANLGLDFGVSCDQALHTLANSRQLANLEAREFVLESPLVGSCPEAADYARSSFAPQRPLLSAVRELVTRIHTEFTYDPGFSSVSTPVSEVLEHRRGVCQDFAHLAIACLRGLGFPARYVSGYLETLPPPGEEKLVGADASHAWFAVYSPAEGWVDFDPTNDQLVGVQHITTAWGRDYSDVSPLKGTLFGGGKSHTVEVEVDVERLSLAASDLAG